MQKGFSNMVTESKKQESFKVSREEVVSTIKKLIQDGNVRRIIIKDKKGKSIAEFPLTVGVVGTVLAPVLAAAGAIAALITECTISVERE